VTERTEDRTLGQILDLLGLLMELPDDPEAERIIAESLGDPDCFRHFLADAAADGQDTSCLRAEVSEQAQLLLSRQ
jgi:hypothetical protein